MADTKLTALSAIGAIAASDIFYLVDDPGGTPVSNKATFSQLVTFLGSSAAVFDNLFLASGAVINWNSSDVTLTHASNELNLTGFTEMNIGADLGLGGFLTINAGSNPSSSGSAIAFFKDRDATVSRRYSFEDVGGLTGDGGGAAFWRGVHFGAPGITDPSGGASVFPRLVYYSEYESLSAPSTRNWCLEMANDTATSRHTFRLRSGNSDIFILEPSGVVSFTSTAQPNSSDGAALGTTTKMWSDLFLAAGGVVNFDNGNVTLTHVSGRLKASNGVLAHFWVYWTGASTTILDSYNVASIDNDATGDAGINLTTAFSSNNYAAFVCTNETGTDGWDDNSIQSCGINVHTAGVVDVLCGVMIDGGTAVGNLTNPDQWNACGFGVSA